MLLGVCDTERLRVEELDDTDGEGVGAPMRLSHFEVLLLARPSMASGVRGAAPEGVEPSTGEVS